MSASSFMQVLGILIHKLLKSKKKGKHTLLHEKQQAGVKGLFGFET